METAITYPTFSEHVLELRRNGMTFAQMAEAVCVTEETVIGWSNGTMPSTNVRAAIERELSYSFAEAKFADAARAVGFPRDDAPAHIRAITTFRALTAYLDEVVELVAHKCIADFLGWEPSSTSSLLARKQVPEPRRFNQLLQKLPELARSVTGDVLTRVTPRTVLGRIIHECRQARGMPAVRYMKYAGHNGVRGDIIRVLEDLGCGAAYMQREMHVEGKRFRAGFFKRDEDHDAVLAFLRQELADLGMTSAQAAGVESAPSDAALAVRAERIVDRVLFEDGGARKIEAAVSAARSPTPPEHIEAPPSLEARVVELEGRLAALEHDVRVTRADANDAGAAARSTFAPGQFREHDDAVSDEELAHVARVLVEAQALLTHLAGITDDTRRWAVQRRLGPGVDELFNAIEGFLRRYPTGALESLDRARKFQERHASRIGGDPPRGA